MKLTYMKSWARNLLCSDLKVLITHLLLLLELWADQPILFEFQRKWKMSFISKTLTQNNFGQTLAPLDNKDYSFNSCE